MNGIVKGKEFSFLSSTASATLFFTSNKNKKGKIILTRKEMATKKYIKGKWKGKRTRLRGEERKAVEEMK